MVDRGTVVDVDNELEAFDVQSIKFLVKNFIHHVKLKKCLSLLDVFTALEVVKHITENNWKEFLSECLLMIGKRNIIHILGLNSSDIEERIQRKEGFLIPFRTALYNIAEDLDSTEIEKLKQEAINMVPNIIPALRKVTSMYDFLDILEKRLLISHHSSDIFLVMLERINRSDLGIFIRDFSGGFYHMTRPYSGMCVIINNKTFSKESKLLPRRGTEFDEERLSQTFTKLKFKTCIYRDLSAEEIVEKITELAEVDHSKYGACVVCILSHGNETAVLGSYGHSVGINHLTSLLSPRNCQSLTGKPKLLFIQACRGIRDQTIQNNNKGQIEEEQHDIGDTNSDIQYIPPPSDPPLGEPRELGDINSDIQYLPPPPDTALRGPHDIADINGDIQCLPPQPDPPLGEPHSLQGEFDFLLGYATTPGYVSYRDCKQGTVYVRTLTEELMAYSDRLDLLSILTIVTNKLSDMNIDGGAGKVHKQCPMPQFSLTKKLYFFPENFV
ncbi:caspase-6-like isoform X2 [Mytilus galloprovincialis]|uniref:caspase-6-like isoform X2 n=1 Tax=Mytilus galloprovincialis TaxID=29158 RepID=UPI003F7B99E2